MFYPGAIEDTENDNLKFNSAYPNPSKGITCIPVESTTNLNAEISMYDIYGRKISEIYKGKIPSGKSNYFVNTSDIASGTYILRFVSDDFNGSQKLIVR